MSNESQISINPAKPSTLEFEVTIQGIEDATPPTVRFVIVSPPEDGDLSFRCTKRTGEKNGWVVKLPKLTHVNSDVAPFRVEVIIDGYYFEPAQGEMTFIKSPDVQFKKSEAKRPSVTTSFVVKQEEDEKPPKKVTEASGGGDVTTHAAPTNALLQPERDPEFEVELGTEFHRATGEKEPDPQAVDIADIAGKVEGGLTDVEGADDLNKAPAKLTRPEKPGSLFKRTTGGKAMIPGLEDPETKKNLVNKAAKVREILGSTE